MTAAGDVSSRSSSSSSSRSRRSRRSRSLTAADGSGSRHGTCGAGGALRCAVQCGAVQCGAVCGMRVRCCVRVAVSGAFLFLRIAFAIAY